MKSPKIVFMLTSELSVQSAGTPRMDRVAHFYLENNFEIFLLDTSSFFFTKLRKFSTKSDYEEFRVGVVNNVRFVNGSRVGKVSLILRYIKHFFLLDIFRISLFSAFIILLNNRKILKKVYSSTPNPTNLILIGVVKFINRNSVTFLDFRDEWALHPHIYFHSTLRRIIEKRVIKISSFVTTVSHGIRNNMIKHYGINKIKVIYNYRDDIHSSGNKIKINKNIYLKEDRINVLFAGTMPEGYYDEDLFIYYLKQLNEKKLIADYNFCFIGFGGLIKEKIEQLPFVVQICYYPAVKHEEILYLMGKFDILLFFAYNGLNNGGIVSTKLLEYMKAKSLVLPFSIKEKSDVDILFNNICGCSLKLNTKSDIDKLLDSSTYWKELPKGKNMFHLDNMKKENFELLLQFINYEK